MLSKHLSEPWFSLIAVGIKKVEGRPLSKIIWNEISEGDIIEWFNEDFGWKRTIRTKILELTKYRDFEHLLTVEGLNETLPGIESIEDGIRLYNKYYTIEEEKSNGVLAITLERVSMY